MNVLYRALPSRERINILVAMPIRSLFRKAEKTIEKYGMLSKGDKILIGVSGGSDSVFLLHLLNALREKYGLTLHIAHLNHGFRREAEREADFVKKLAKTHGIPSTVKKIDVPFYAKKRRLSKQEAAREVRYSFLREVADKTGANKIALGHTADDQAETFIMKLIRGAGPKGMAGIYPSYEEQEGRALIRPLIELGRREIIDCLRKNRIQFVKDPSNISDLYLRSRIRNKFIPHLEKKYNPKIKETFVRSAEILREEDSFLEDYSRKILKGLLKLKDKERIEISIEPFLKLDRAIKRRLLRIIIEELRGDIKGFSMHHIDEVMDSIAAGRTGRRINLPKGVTVQRDYDLLSIYLKDARNQTSDFRHGTYNVNVPGITEIPELGLTLWTEIKKAPAGFGNGKAQAAFDIEKIPGKIMVRKKREGDFFYPFGMDGKKKKLKSYFIDKKVRREERDKIPILLSGDDIIWVVGYRMDERFRVDEGTKMVLIVKVER